MPEKNGGLRWVVGLLFIAVLGALWLSDHMTTRTAAAEPAVCKLPGSALKAGSASIAQTASGTLQSKQWQPEGGLIEITIDNYKADEDAVVTTCFRWKLENQAKAASFAESKPKSVSLINGVLKVTVEVPPLTDTDQPRARRVFVVPLAQVRVLSVKSDDTVQMDTWTEIGITYPIASLTLAIGILLLAFYALNRVVKSRITHNGIKQANLLLRIISTPTGTASLSQLQILLWTFVVAGCAIYVASLSGQLVEVTTGTLVLLGIRGVAALGTQAHNENQDATKRAEAERLQAEADSTKAAADAAKTAADKAEADAKAAQDAFTAKPSETTLQVAATEAANRATEARKAAADASQKADEAAKKVTPAATKSPDPDRVPQWSDLIVNENDEKGREI